MKDTLILTVLILAVFAFGYGLVSLVAFGWEVLTFLATDMDCQAARVTAPETVPIMRVIHL